MVEFIQGNFVVYVQFTFSVRKCLWVLRVFVSRKERNIWTWRCKPTVALASPDVGLASTAVVT